MHTHCAMCILTPHSPPPPSSYRHIARTLYHGLYARRSVSRLGPLQYALIRSPTHGTYCLQHLQNAHYAVSFVAHLFTAIFRHNNIPIMHRGNLHEPNTCDHRLYRLVISQQHQLAWCNTSCSNMIEYSIRLFILQCYYYLLITPKQLTCRHKYDKSSEH